MEANRPNLSHGRQAEPIEITVIEAGTESATVSSYTVAGPGRETCTLVAGPNVDRVFEPGEDYRIEAALGFDPGFDERATFADAFQRTADDECPNCGGELTFDPDLEVPSGEILEFLTNRDEDGISLVCTERSRVYGVSSGDDWRPFRETTAIRTPSPHYRCTECSRTIPEDELDRYLEHGDDAWNAERAILESAAPMDSMHQSVGMATGGAKDVDNFRDNVAEGYLPDVDALTYEGLFYDYYFDTGDSGRDADSLFYPSYSTAATEHPLTGETEYFLTVGLNSTLSVDEFERRRLNLVAVLDVSGSMGGQFDRYYYDEHGNRREHDDRGDGTKMRAATESLAALTTHLEPEDRFGVVLYNSRSHVAKPLSLVGDTDMDAIRGHIGDVQAGGGTNMSAGLESAIDLLAGYDGGDPTVVENRILFLTDMMPNTGSTGENAISGTIECAADRGIYTTFVGMGLDANPELIESLSNVRGANHYFVHSVAEFEQRLDDEFEYMVTPLVFDLQLELDGDIDVREVYGSPTADRATGRLVHVSTLFPSPTDGGETRGGVVLLQLDGEPSGALELVASWEEIDGTVRSDTVDVSFPATTPEAFADTGIRKAVSLSRYCTVLRNWMRDARNAAESDDWVPMDRPETPRRGRWERESVALTVPEEYRSKFETLRTHLDETAGAVGDPTLRREVELLDDLVAYENPETAALDGEAFDRLADVVALAPTTNGELADAWGMKTGADVHAYLEAELGDLYERDETGRIVPTERGRSLVARVGR